MDKVRLSVLLLGGLLVAQVNQAQSVFNNASNLVAGSDNTGDPDYQPGTEVLNSTPGLGVALASDGSFEHIGQFYVAANGIWNRNTDKSQATVGTDYFGYAPAGVGSNTAYLGRGILGASAINGGRGVGRPTFGHLQLNSTGEFPLEGGMYITRSLSFNANGPGKSCVITTPNSSEPDSPVNAVVFAPSAFISGANHSNYINGYVSVTGVSQPFTLPLGDAEGFPNSLCPLTINSATPGTVTARYRHTIQHPTTALGPGLGSVSVIGDWPISAPEGTRITVSMPALGIDPAEAATLRLVGWNGSQWVDLSDGMTAGGCAMAGCPLIGTISAHITDLAIGSTSRALAEKGESDATNLVIWPNPTQGPLNLALSAGKTIQEVRVLDLQGRSLIRPNLGASSVNTSNLPVGTYLVEVFTTQGQTLRKQFVKQP